MNKIGIWINIGKYFVNGFILFFWYNCIIFCCSFCCVVWFLELYFFFNFIIFGCNVCIVFVFFVCLIINGNNVKWMIRVVIIIVKL